MISRTHRFHGRAGLRFVYQNGKSVRGPLFSLRYVANPRRDSYRIAVVVSRKVHKSAVARNRMRRRLYAAARAIEKDISGSPDIVLTVFSDSLLKEPAPKLESQLKSQFTQAGLIG